MKIIKEKIWKVTIKGSQEVVAEDEQEAAEHQDIGCPNNIEYIDVELVREKEIKIRDYFPSYGIK